MNLIGKLILLSSFTFFCCGQSFEKPIQPESTLLTPDKIGIIDNNGAILITRFNTPAGYGRKSVPNNSFAFYLRNIPLKTAGAKVKYFNGTEKESDVYDAVIDMDIGSKDLQQCADAVMRLRAEYFYSLMEYEKISFTLTNGFKVDYCEWMKGNRIVVNGNKTTWRKLADPSNTYTNFREYMELIFNYAGTLSLSKSLHHKNIKDMEIGDVFIVGGSPGHAVIVVDVAENNAGKKIFMLAQSYMPAQDIQILKNLNDVKLSPWYSSEIPGYLVTPQWSFDINQLMTW